MPRYNIIQVVLSDYMRDVIEYTSYKKDKSVSEIAGKILSEHFSKEENLPQGFLSWRYDPENKKSTIKKKPK